MADDQVGTLQLDPCETSRRIRAAKNYKGDISWSELAEVTGIGKPTLERMTRMVDPQPARAEQLDAIADATGVPRAFMRLGWKPYDFVALDEDGNPVAVFQTKGILAGPDRVVHHGPGSGKTMALLTYRVAAIEAFLAQWINEDPALFAAPLPALPDWLGAPLPDSEASEPTPDSEPPEPEPERRRRAAGRRRAA